MSTKTLFEQVTECVRINPKITRPDLDKLFPDAKMTTLREYLRRVHRKLDAMKLLGLKTLEKPKLKAKYSGKIPTFKEFVETEAIPKPIHRKTKQFVGILDYELEGYELFEKYDEICLLWPREHGKTWLVAWYIEYKMKYFGENFIYLSITRMRNRVANWVWQFCHINNLLQANPNIKRGMISTYQHFELKNGAIFEVYRFLDKEVLGMHNFTIVTDDIVDKRWQSQRAEQEKALDYWNFTLGYIGRNKLIIVGTRKFEGDLLELILEEHEGFMHVDKRTPYKQCKCAELNLNELGIFDYCDICKEQSLLAPEIHTQEEFEKKKKKSIFAWNAEMMQNPFPKTGEAWDVGEFGYQFETQIPYIWYYDTFFIYIDRATTLKKTSDYTGCIMGIREIKTGVRLITHDFTGNISINDLHLLVNETVSIWRSKYEHMQIYLIVEKQGGGDDFLTLISTQSFFLDKGEKIPNKIREICIIREITSTGKKHFRIQNRLHAPLTNKMIQFVSNLKNSELMKELETFPYCAKLDAIDALSMGDWEIAQLPATESGNYAKDMLNILRERKKVLELTNKSIPSFLNDLNAKYRQTQPKTVFP